MRYGFIGLGNMATAIISGMIKNDFNPSDIYGFDINEERRTLLKEKGINIQATEEMVFTEVETIILAIKPQVLGGVLDKLNTYKKNFPNELAEKTIITIAAGMPISYYEGIIGEKKIIRVMPNMNAFIGEATSCYTGNHLITATEEQMVEDIFSSIGTIEKIDESFFSAFTSIACASPAFSYMYIDALARAGLTNGLSKEESIRAAAHSVMGSAKMILDNPEIHPYELIDRVTSPGGTTIAGINTLKEKGFEDAINSAVKAVMDRDTEISES